MMANTEQTNVSDYTQSDYTMPDSDYTPPAQQAEPSQNPTEISANVPHYAEPYAYSAVPYYDYASPSREAVQPQRPVISTAPTAPQRSRSKLLYEIVATMSVLAVLCAGVYAALFFTGRLAGSTNEQPSRANFASASCPFALGTDIIEGRNVSCGFVTAPEDPVHPDQATVQLAVAIFHAAHPHSNTAPMLFLQGGPGGGLLEVLGSRITLSNMNKVTLGRDLILLDQRGTGYSKPKLNCYETLFAQQNAPTDTGGQGQQKTFQQKLLACHDRLISNNIHLANYTTLTDANDVHTAIHALGYQQVDLYGVSYGTRLALTTMRMFPDDVRSVVLDSTVPTQENLFNEEPIVIQHALDVLFAGCSASQSCSTAYPQLQSTFYQLVTSLDANPITIDDAQDGAVSITGIDLSIWIQASMYDTRKIPELPRDIMQISQGNYSSLTQSYISIISHPEISEGVYYSVECGEDMAFTNPQTIHQAVSTIHPELQSSMQQGLQYSYDICQQWHQPAIPLIQKQPVTSTIPTLILAGEYDPITPPSEGKLAMKTLSHSYFFQFPGTGHGVFLTSNCAETITTGFLNAPTSRPDGSCLSSVNEPAFT